MKIIEALKKIKHFDRKLKQNADRTREWSSYLQSKDSEGEKPQYTADELKAMRQQSFDWMVEKAKLRHALHKTNMNTSAEFNGKKYTIDELLILQKEIFPGSISLWKNLQRKEKGYGDKEQMVVVQFDHRERDKAIDSIENSMETLDSLLDQLTLQTEVVE